MEENKDRIITLKDKQIIIKNEVINQIENYKQIRCEHPESGGVLIGRESIENNTIVIELITEPYESDIQSRCGYIRKDTRHISDYQKIYEKYNKVYAYIGEWHTHPEDYPNYSSIDLKNWKRIANENEDREKVYYHIIVGIKEIRIWEYAFGEKRPKRIY